MWYASNEGFARTLIIDCPDAVNALSPAIVDASIAQRRGEGGASRFSSGAGRHGPFTGNQDINHD